MFACAFVSVCFSVFEWMYDCVCLFARVCFSVFEWMYDCVYVITCV